jgi:prephenate dehydrogenase
MANPQITIIGLGLVGGSMGLALAASAMPLKIVGHDIDAGRGRLAKKMGAVNESRMNLIDACQDADLIIVATPLTAVRETLELIGPHLKHGCVVTDTATLKEPVLAWASEVLPAGVYFVGGDPVLSRSFHPDDTEGLPGIQQARSDLFQEAFYFLCAPAKASPAAVKRVSDMATLLGARPFFVDPIEHDGMRAAVEGLPMLVSLALMREVSDSPGWREARKIAGHDFGEATALLDREAAIQRTLILLNAPHLLPRLEALIREMAQLRDWITAEDGPALEQAFEQATSARARWLRDRQRSEWGEELGEMGISGTFDTLKGALGLGSRNPKREDD